MTPRRLLALTAVGTLLLTGCGPTDTTQEAEPQDHTVQAVTTFSILTDMVETIGGDQVHVHNLVPVGQDPHEYEATPDDTTALADADVFFTNGLNLEGGDNGWAARMAQSVGITADHVVETTQGVEPLYLAQGVEDSVNPHAYLDPQIGMVMAENIAEGLIAADTDNADMYQQNLDQYLDELQQLHEKYVTQFGELSDEQRVLVTSERAFQYVAASYDLLEGYIWAVDTDDLGTPDQIISTIEFVRQHEPSALFLESNVASAPMETVAQDTGVEIFGTVYSDELAPEGTPGDTYLGMLEENLTTITEGLSQ